MAHRIGKRLVLVGLAVGVYFGCTGDSTTTPTPAGKAVSVSSAGGGVTASNVAPRLLFTVRESVGSPPAFYEPNSRPYPTLYAGPAPSSVYFGLCRSDDSDVGDDLNWQFWFGDKNQGGSQFVDGGRPDFERQCKTDHVYRNQGSYTATLLVTDKHLEDQGRAGALARTIQNVTIVVGPVPPPVTTVPPNLTCSITNFQGSWSGENAHNISAGSFRISSYVVPALFNWTVTGSVTSVKLLTAGNVTLTGLPATATNFSTTYDGCFTYTLTATCGNGSTPFQNFNFNNCG